MEPAYLNTTLLPVINAICEEIRLVEVIDELVDWDKAKGRDFA
jgi:hypothetical protein